MIATGRPREFDRAAALEAAMHLFWRKGFRSASMTDLCDAMRIRSPSLYAAYGSKEALYLEAINHYAATVGAALWNRVDNAESARAGVESMLMAAAEMLPESADGPAGCMAMLAAAWRGCARVWRRGWRTANCQSTRTSTGQHASSWGSTRAWPLRRRTAPPRNNSGR